MHVQTQMQSKVFFGRLSEDLPSLAETIGNKMGIKKDLTCRLDQRVPSVEKRHLMEGTVKQQILTF